jgi:hypothetical protein
MTLLLLGDFTKLAIKCLPAGNSTGGAIRRALAVKVGAFLLSAPGPASGQNREAMGVHEYLPIL